MVTLTDLFLSKQQEMQASLGTSLSHCVAQGDNSEETWKQFFKKYLPARYACDKGFIIDSDNHLSDQIDLIVYDNYFSPFFFNHGGNTYIPAESVYAVFEIKPTLNKKNFNYAKDKASSVRCLKRTSASVVANGKKCKGRQQFPIIAGILTNTSSWESVLPNQVADPAADDFIDLCCSADGYSWTVRQTEDGYKYIKNTHRGESLLAFLMELLHQLQKRGTAAALDIPKYFDGFEAK